MNARKFLLATGFLIAFILNALEANAAPQKSDQSTSQSTLRHKAYDPLKIPKGEIESLELMVKDKTRNREIPLLVYVPKTKKATEVILHSHGLGGQKETSPFLGRHWAARGFMAVFLQHPGSDNAVWQGVPISKVMSSMKKAASAENLTLRIGDVKATIDQLEKWNVDKKHPLHKRLDLKHIGMSGHSFGAVTTQNIGGQTYAGRDKSDPRICAAIPMSPSLPRMGNAKKAFQNAKIPWLCMTGTKDKSMITTSTPESRTEVFKALPKGNKYELVLHGAEHLAFTETNMRISRGKKKRNPNHYQAIKALSTAFWEAHLREDKNAIKWLNSDSVRDVLEKEDRWQSK